MWAASEGCSEGGECDEKRSERTASAMQGAAVNRLTPWGAWMRARGLDPPSGYPFLPLENGVGDRNDGNAQAWEENRDERVCVEGWVVKLLGEQ